VNAHCRNDVFAAVPAQARHASPDRWFVVSVVVAVAPAVMPSGPLMSAVGWSRTSPPDVTRRAMRPDPYVYWVLTVNWMLSPFARLTTANVALTPMLPTVEASNVAASSTDLAAVAVIVPTT
jgi:hypothetical protein